MKNKKITIGIFVLGIIIALVLGGIGFIKQNNVKKANEEGIQKALEQSNVEKEKANKRLKEIEIEISQLQEQYSEKQQKIQLMNMMNYTWSPEYSQLQVEVNNIYSQIVSLENENLEIKNNDYIVNYEPIESIKYKRFYYIGVGIFTMMSLIALIYFLITKKHIDNN